MRMMKIEFVTFSSTQSKKYSFAVISTHIHTRDVYNAKKDTCKVEREFFWEVNSELATPVIL